jgi:protein PhnA
MTDDDVIVVKDSNGTRLHDGDTVHVIKDLKVKGTSSVIKQGTKIKGIRLTDVEDEIECRVDNIKGLVLKTQFLKRVN